MAALREGDDWIPVAAARDQAAAVQRRHLIRKWAAAGYDSRQMAERLGIDAGAIRKIARQIRVPVPADEIVVKTHRHDATRVARETVQALDGLAMGVSLVNLDGIDPAEAQTWTGPMTEALRTLTRFANQIKEIAR